MALNLIQTFILKEGDIDNFCPDYDAPNAALKEKYNSNRGYWVERFVTKIFTPPHMNKVLV